MKLKSPNRAPLKQCTEKICKLQEETFALSSPWKGNKGFWSPTRYKHRDRDRPPCVPESLQTSLASCYCQSVPGLFKLYNKT